MTSKRKAKSGAAGERARKAVKKELKVDQATKQEPLEAQSTCIGNVRVSQSPNNEPLNNACQASNTHRYAHINHLEKLQRFRNPHDEENDTQKLLSGHTIAKPEESDEVQTYVYPEPSCWRNLTITTTLALLRSRPAWRTTILRDARTRTAKVPS
ncbi:uncharacterized protein BKA78DRAFT_132010 [Phyllosticta capitalensis]|uniref:uncharacterized protein n=1 Tax=Phyllosticta capitalensis TaxID=121624 RepID=UPI00312ECCE8